tara:strand:- start:141 stop:263 length:123 start_codon:yes stop_codon:yes gene_type:complete
MENHHERYPSIAVFLGLIVWMIKDLDERKAGVKEIGSCWV